MEEGSTLFTKQFGVGRDTRVELNAFQLTIFQDERMAKKSFELSTILTNRMVGEDWKWKTEA